MHSDPTTHIIIFAKEPIPGKVKTRLAASIGYARAAEMAAYLLQQTLGHVQQALAEHPRLSAELCVSPDPLASYWQAYDWTMTAQETGDLGERLARVARARLQRYDQILLIGTDCPSLTPYYLLEAINALKKNDTVIFPATDGGYVLLGLTHFDLSLFTDIQWSTAVVAEQTHQRIQTLGWSCYLGEPLADIDRPEDLVGLPKGMV